VTYPGGVVVVVEVVSIVPVVVVDDAVVPGIVLGDVCVTFPVLVEVVCGARSCIEPL
jgi:hypothetical protein